MNITASTISANTALGGDGSEPGTGKGSDQNCSGFGGGIYSIKSLTLSSSTLSGNIAEGEQQQDMYGGGGGYGLGGGAYTAGSATITACSVISNKCVGGLGEEGGSTGSSKVLAGTGGSGEGAGPFNAGTLTITNTTVADNQAK